MRLSVFSTALYSLDWGAMLGWLADNGVGNLELGCGAYPGTRHANAHLLRDDAAHRRKVQADLAAHGVTLAALACHGNPLHPDPAVSSSHHSDLLAAVEAAHALQVPVVVCFSGQAGDRPFSSSAPTPMASPNWPVLGWPDEYSTLRSWQWERCLIPYWEKMAKHAQNLGVKLALEMHGGFAVHNPATLLQLRQACGPALGANLDPSHCWWQCMDPLVSVAVLNDALFHVHLKDTVFNARVMAENGLLHVVPGADPAERPWSFALPGDGHGPEFWRSLLSALEQQRYLGVVSIEHEAPMDPVLGVLKTLQFMRGLGLADGA